MALSAMKKSMMAYYFRLMADRIPAREISAGPGNALDVEAIPAINGNTLTDGSVGAGAIADRTIPAVKLILNTITSDEIGIGAVTEPAITNLCITADKLAEACVTNAKLKDFNPDPDPELYHPGITTAKIGDRQVTQAKIGLQAVANAQMAIGAALENITHHTIKGDSDPLTVNQKIGTKTITGYTSPAIEGNIAQSTISEYNIKPLTITGASLATGAVIAGKIAAGAINNTNQIGAVITNANLAAGFSMIRAVTRNTASITVGNSSTTASIAILSMAKAFVVVTSIRDSGTSFEVTAKITSLSNISFTRIGTLGTTTIEWQVIEYL